MGGNGGYYDRNVTATHKTTNTKGHSEDAQQALQQHKMDPELLPKNCKLTCSKLNPLIYCFDVTGSMGKLPKIIWDKWPGIVGQIIARDYLPEPEMSIAAVGDIRSDRSPLQVCDFDSLRNLDSWLSRIHYEGNGGNQDSESYEMIAYYYLHRFEMPHAELPIFLMTGDEACVEDLHADDLQRHFGGEHKSTTAEAVFAGLIEKFQGNVFRIHKRYHGNNSKVVAQWERLIGPERIIHLPDDRAIGDVTLGLYAVASGARTVDQYIEDMSTRPLNLAEGVSFEPQSEERIAQVAEALAPLQGYKPLRRYTGSSLNPGGVAATSSRQSTSP
jgi:hypothetical protein